MAWFLYRDRSSEARLGMRQNGMYSGQPSKNEKAIWMPGALAAASTRYEYVKKQADR